MIIHQSQLFLSFMNPEAVIINRQIESDDDDDDVHHSIDK
jgi:hypothetical protein